MCFRRCRWLVFSVCVYVIVWICVYIYRTYVVVLVLRAYYHGKRNTTRNLYRCVLDVRYERDARMQRETTSRSYKFFGITHTGIRCPAESRPCLMSTRPLAISWSCCSLYIYTDDVVQQLICPYKPSRAKRATHTHSCRNGGHCRGSTVKCAITSSQDIYTHTTHLKVKSGPADGQHIRRSSPYYSGCI